ncbi:MAG: phytoene desaturase family protein, partial [Gemmatimonadaceae bacterium]
DGSVFNYRADDAALADEVRRFEPRDVAGYRRFSAFADAALRRAMPLIDVPFLHFGDMLRALPDLVRTRAWRSVAGVAASCFRDPRLRQVFSFQPLLIGGNPFTSPALYTLIHALEKRWGVWFPMGGMGELVRAMAQLFGELGGDICLTSEVARIELDAAGQRAVGVRLTSGQRVAADAVVSNADAAATYAGLLEQGAGGAARGARRGRRGAEGTTRRRPRYSMSLFVLYFGTDRRYDGTAHHEILMGQRYRGLLDDVFRQRRLSDDFSLYLHRPTATDSTLAPNGCDAFYALAPVPNLQGAIDWETAAPRYRDRVVEYLEAQHLPGLSRHLVTEHHVDPRYFRDVLGSPFGAAFALQPLLSQSAWLRPHNRCRRIPNLYFAGAGTHPGAGIPGVLSSGKIVAQLIGPAQRSRHAADKAGCEAAEPLRIALGAGPPASVQLHS